MALLTVDLGNSRIKWASWREARMAASGAAAYREHAPDRPWEHCWRELDAPRRLVVASVAPSETDRALAEWCRGNWGIEAEFLRSSARAGGVVNGYRDPARLGVDRWAALVAARHAFPERAVCVADCGTAVTIDCLDGGGRHEGGVILPGLTLMRESLYSATAGLAPQCPSELEPGRLGRDTASGIFLGCCHALAGAMERVAAELSEAGGAPVCLITGGAAPALLPCLDSRWQLRPHLVLEGARILALERPPGGGP